MRFLASFLFLCVLSLSFLSLSPSVSAFGLGVHKEIVRTALIYANQPQLTEPLQEGVVYNDMPDEEVNPRLPKGFRSLTAAGFLFQIAQEASLPFASHYGCLQFWHGMSPVVKGYPLVRFTNLQLKEIIMMQARMWWQQAVSYQKQHQSAFALGVIGQLVHTIEDLHSRSHSVRGQESIYKGSSFEKLALYSRIKTGFLKGQPLKCGQIYYLQGYQTQKGSVFDRRDSSFHSYYDRSPYDYAVDKWSSPPDWFVQVNQYQCAVFASTMVLDQYKECRADHKKCDAGWKTVEDLLSNYVLKIAPSSHNIVSGGTWSRIANTGKVDSDYKLTDIPTDTGKVQVYVPTGGYMWNDPKGDVKVTLCRGSWNVMNPIGKINKLAALRPNGAFCTSDSVCESGNCGFLRHCEPKSSSKKSEAELDEAGFEEMELDSAEGESKLGELEDLLHSKPEAKQESQPEPQPEPLPLPSPAVSKHAPAHRSHSNEDVSVEVHVSVA